MKLKLNVAMMGKLKGAIIDVESVANIPSELFWRKRLNDSLIDNCVEIVKQRKRKTSGERL